MVQRWHRLKLSEVVLHRRQTFSRGKLGVSAFSAHLRMPFVVVGSSTAPLLILSNKSSPRKVIGSVDTTAFFVTSAEILTFLWLLGVGQFRWDWIIAFVVGED
jgi:hypothetical protein